MAEEKKSTKPLATLIKSYPIKRTINTPEGVLTYDAMLIFYRDDKGIKHYQYVNRAEIPYSILKEPSDVYLPFVEVDKVETINVYSDQIYHDIAMRTNSWQFYDRAIFDKNPSNWDKGPPSSLKNLFKHPLIYDADMPLADRYIAKFNNAFDPDSNFVPHKCYFDIEVDLMEKGFGHDGHHGFPDEDKAPCPVNIISLIDDKLLIGYLFVIRNELNDSLKEFERDVDQFRKDLLAEVATEDQVLLNDIKILFYDNEIDAIIAFFKTVHENDPDFASAWNMCFDIRTMLTRLQKYYKKHSNSSNGTPNEQVATAVSDSRYYIQKGLKGETIYLTPNVYYSAQKDKDLVDRIDNFNILDGTVWLD